MVRRRAGGEQLDFIFGQKPCEHGGSRRGAGRPRRKGPPKRVPHVPRERFPKRLPQHVTVRVRREVWNLRSRRAFRVIERALRAASDRFGVRVVHFAVQANHVHLIVEATDATCLSRAMQGLGVRLAKGLNRMMGRHGRVLEERYHVHVLRTPTETRHAVRYVLGNERKHAAQRGVAKPEHYADWFSSAHHPDLVRAAQTWMLTTGCRSAESGFG